MTIQETIDRAFANVPYPGDTHITSHRCSECDEIANYFRGTTWRGHSVELLRYHSAALSLFTPEAYHYFLPAFLLATLEDAKAADVIPGSIIFGFISTSDVDRRLALFTPQQRDAVIRFLRHLVEGGVCSEHEFQSAVETLSSK